MGKRCLNSKQKKEDIATRVKSDSLWDRSERSGKEQNQDLEYFDFFKQVNKNKVSSWTSLVIQWLQAFNARGTGLTAGQGAKIPQAAWQSQKNFF